ncbi:MIZ zinc finger family protein [Aphelenchoides avenae]|nr:MIZ zinc finger family protein [Aphelenchus avenae]
MTFRARVVSYDESKQRIIDAYESTAKDGGVEVDELRVSLVCTISKASIKTPVRSTTCMHLQCFDLDNFIDSNASREKPKCPICNVDINTSQLVVDEYFQSVLSVAAKDNASEVELLRDGGFRFPRPAGSSVSTSVTEEVADMSVDELEEGEVVDTDDSVRSVEKKTEPNGTGAPRRRGYIPCDICGKLCRREKDLNEHNSRVHVPQIASWSCTVCSERFYNESARNNHEDTAHGEKV